jgi:hypothetical protein
MTIICPRCQNIFDVSGYGSEHRIEAVTAICPYCDWAMYNSSDLLDILGTQSQEEFPEDLLY